jgi:N-acetylglucosaminylphosphatidylinositol deacetylase
MVRTVNLLLALVPLVALFLLQSSYPKPLAPHERVLLLTAHPDDECFFFGPTLLGLREQGTLVYSLCVSNGASCLLPLRARLTRFQPGNYDGIGVRREQELRDSLSVFGIPSEMSFLINHP